MVAGQGASRAVGAECGQARRALSRSSGAHFSRALALARSGAGPRANARGSRQQGLRVFLDANVLFSAALAARGTASALLLLADTAGADCADCVSSACAWAEADRNLAAKLLALNRERARS